MAKLVRELTYARVVSTVALFVALGGGAYAISLGRGDVNSRIIQNDTIRSADVKPDSLKGSDIRERTLKLSEFTAATSSGTTASTCTPPDDGFGPCGELSLTTSVGGRILAIASGQKTANPTSASGSCQLLLDGTAFAKTDLGGTGAASVDQFSFAGVSPTARPGAHAVALQCLGGGATGDLSYRIDGITATLAGGK